MNEAVSRRTLIQGAAFAALALATKRAPAAADTRPPVLYVSHGSPIFVANDPARIAELRTWGERLRKPRGIVVMTPHFATRGMELGATGRGFAMYDLPPRMKRRIPPGLDYPTPASAGLAERVDAAVGSASARSAGRRGFDHTTWMPLMCLFPAADVPVVEMAYPYRTDAELFALGCKLATLRDEGVLFLASGGMTHNLASVDFDHPASDPPSWSREFDGWASERLAARDIDALVDWRQQAPAQALAHPDDGGHYRVLLVALGVAFGGARGPAEVSFPVSGYESTMSKRSVQLE